MEFTPPAVPAIQNRLLAFKAELTDLAEGIFLTLWVCLCWMYYHVTSRDQMRSVQLSVLSQVTRLLVSWDCQSAVSESHQVWSLHMTSWRHTVPAPATPTSAMHNWWYAQMSYQDSGPCLELYWTLSIKLRKFNIILLSLLIFNAFSAKDLFFFLKEKLAVSSSTPRLVILKIYQIISDDK